MQSWGIKAMILPFALASLAAAAGPGQGPHFSQFPDFDRSIPPTPPTAPYNVFTVPKGIRGVGCGIAIETNWWRPSPGRWMGVSQRHLRNPATDKTRFGLQVWNFEQVGHVQSYRGHPTELGVMDPVNVCWALEIATQLSVRDGDGSKWNSPEATKTCEDWRTGFISRLSDADRARKVEEDRKWLRRKGEILAGAAAGGAVTVGIGAIMLAYPSLKAAHAARHGTPIPELQMQPLEHPGIAQGQHSEHNEHSEKPLEGEPLDNWFKSGSTSRSRSHKERGGSTRHARRAHSAGLAEDKAAVNWSRHGIERHRKL